LFATIATFGEKKEHDYVKEKHNCTKQAQKMSLCEVNDCDVQRTQQETHFMLNQRGNNNFKAHLVVLLFYVLPSQLHLMNHYN
jgi:DNA polymerase/3'-5' exonuclease PolX